MFVRTSMAVATRCKVIKAQAWYHYILTLALTYTGKMNVIKRKHSSHAESQVNILSLIINCNSIDSSFLFFCITFTEDTEYF